MYKYIIESEITDSLDHGDIGLIVTTRVLSNRPLKNKNLKEVLDFMMEFDFYGTTNKKDRTTCDLASDCKEVSFEYIKNSKLGKKDFNNFEADIFFKFYNDNSYRILDGNLHFQQFKNVVQVLEEKLKIYKMLFKNKECSFLDDIYDDRIVLNNKLIINEDSFTNDMLDSVYDSLWDLYGENIIRKQ